MILYVFALIGMTILGALASVQLKKASASDSIADLLKNKYLYFGAILYLLSSVLNIIALRRFEYSFVLPFTAVTYIWTMLLAKTFFGVKITRRKICGVLFIVGGAVLIALGSI